MFFMVLFLLVSKNRYQVLEQVGAAAFSRAVQAYDTLERRLVCLKVVKVRRSLPLRHSLLACSS